EPPAPLRGGGRALPRAARSRRHSRAPHRARRGARLARTGGIMSRIYDALKKLEAERRGGKGNGAPGGNGGNGGNGSGNGKRNGNGRSRWRWLFARPPRREAEPRVTLDFRLGPEVEEAYQRLGTNLLVAPGPDAAPVPRLLGVTASRHGEGTTTTVAVFASILVRRRSARIPEVERTRRSLERVGVRLVGSVLNRRRDYIPAFLEELL